jgi:pimeloyl-ACP methyl ester carboxylesterase
MLNIVLVHGAFADASSWNGIIERLQGQGHTVVAPANPLRGLADDTAYIAGVVDQIDGPVLLVGHSYAGAVISNAAANARNVVGLVFVAAFAPDDGEWLGDVTARSKDAILGPALLQRMYPIGRDGQTGVELVVDPARFHDVFAADLPADLSAVLAASQRPIAQGAFSEKAEPPAWKTVSSWAVVATRDKAAGADLVRSMAQRAGAKITEIDGSHLIMVSQPDAVTEVILQAARAVAEPAGAGKPQ